MEDHKSSIALVGGLAGTMVICFVIGFSAIWSALDAMRSDLRVMRIDIHTALTKIRKEIATINIIAVPQYNQLDGLQGNVEKIKHVIYKN